MTMLDERLAAPTEASPPSLTANRLSRVQHGIVMVAAVIIGALSWLPQGSPNWARWIIVSLISYCVGVYVVARVIEGRRKAFDRLMLALVTQRVRHRRVAPGLVGVDRDQRGLRDSTRNSSPRPCAARSAREVVRITPSSAP